MRLTGVPIAPEKLPQFLPCPRRPRAGGKLPSGFDNRYLREHRAPVLGVSAADWSAGRMNYDLRPIAGPPADRTHPAQLALPYHHRRASARRSTTREGVWSRSGRRLWCDPGSRVVRSFAVLRGSFSWGIGEESGSVGCEVAIKSRENV